MSDENHDPWALLREARSIVDLAASRDVRFDNGLLARIDAALAAHEAVSPSEVEWIPNGPRGLSGYLKGRVEKASVYQTKDGLWWASASDVGPFNTLDEAQAAAIAAARGMR